MTRYLYFWSIDATSFAGLYKGIAKPTIFNCLIFLSYFLQIIKMTFLSMFRNPAALGALNLATLLGLCGSTYLLRSHLVELSEDHEARMVRMIFVFYSMLYQLPN
jgi:hypothetical protein